MFFFNFLKTFSLTHGLFRNVLFIFHVFSDFSSYLSVIDFQFDFTMVKKHTVYDFNSFKFVDASFMVQGIVYPGIQSMGTWTEHILLLLSAKFDKCLLDCIG